MAAIFTKINIKATLRYHCTPIRMPKFLKNWKLQAYRQGCRKLKFSYFTSRRTKCCSHYASIL